MEISTLDVKERLDSTRNILEAETSTSDTKEHLDSIPSTIADEPFRLDVQDYIVSEQEDKRRKTLCQEMGHELMEDLGKNLGDFHNFNKQIKYPESIPLSTNPNWFQRPYGATGKVHECTTLAFIAKLILDSFGLTYITLDSILDEIVKKHYRLWRLLYRDKILCSPEITVEGLKAAFPEDTQIQECTSLPEIYSVAGNPVGIGESPYFLDNLIYSICSWMHIPISIYDDTRIPEANQILENLKLGCPVPLRVSTEIYLGDSRPKNEYYVTLYGIEAGRAYVVDSKREHLTGIRSIPIDTFLDAMTKDPDSVCAWDLYPLFKPDEFINPAE